MARNIDRRRPMDIDPAARFLIEHIADEEKDKFVMKNHIMKEKQRKAAQQAEENLKQLAGKRGGRVRKDPDYQPNILDFAFEMAGKRAQKLKKEIVEGRKAQKAFKAHGPPPPEDPDHHEWATMMAKNAGLDMERRGIDTLQGYKEWKVRKARLHSATSRERPTTGRSETRPATALGISGSAKAQETIPVSLAAHRQHKSRLQSAKASFSTPASTRPQLKYTGNKPEAQFELIPTGRQRTTAAIPVTLVLGGAFTIGRDHKCDLQITRELCSADGLKSLSREHCKICQDERGNLTLVDNSANGTFVNGRLCKGGSETSSTPLVPGDSILFGNALGNCCFTLDLSFQRPQLTKVEIVKDATPPATPVVEYTQRQELPEEDPRTRILAGNIPVAISNVGRARDLWGNSGKHLTMASTRRVVSLAVSGCPEQCLHAAMALRSLASYHTGLNYLIAAGGVSALSSLAARGQGGCKAEAVAALHSIILGSAEGRSRVRSDGGLAALSRVATDPSQPLQQACATAVQDLHHLSAQMPPPPSRLIHSRPGTATSSGSTQILYAASESSRPVTATSAASTQVLAGGSDGTASELGPDGALSSDDLRPRSALPPRIRPFSAQLESGPHQTPPRPTTAGPAPYLLKARARSPPGFRAGGGRGSRRRHGGGLTIGEALLRQGGLPGSSLEAADEPGDSSDSTHVGGATDGSDSETGKAGRWWEDPSGEGYGGLEQEGFAEDDDGRSVWSPAGLPLDRDEAPAAAAHAHPADTEAARPWSALPRAEARGPLDLSWEQRPSSAGHYGVGVGSSDAGRLRAGGDGRLGARTRSAGSSLALRPGSALGTIMEVSHVGEAASPLPDTAGRATLFPRAGADPAQDATFGGEEALGDEEEWWGLGDELSSEAESGEEVALRMSPMALAATARPRTASPNGMRSRRGRGSPTQALSELRIHWPPPDVNVSPLRLSRFTEHWGSPPPKGRKGAGEGGASETWPEAEDGWTGSEADGEAPEECHEDAGSQLEVVGGGGATGRLLRPTSAVPRGQRRSQDGGLAREDARVGQLARSGPTAGRGPDHVRSAALEPRAGSKGGGGRGKAEDGERGRRLSTEHSALAYRSAMLGVRHEIGALWDSFRSKNKEEKAARRQEHEEILAMERESEGADADSEDARDVEMAGGASERPRSAQQGMDGWDWHKAQRQQGEQEQSDPTGSSSANELEEPDGAGEHLHAPDRGSGQLPPSPASSSRLRLDARSSSAGEVVDRRLGREMRAQPAATAGGGHRSQGKGQAQHKPPARERVELQLGASSGPVGIEQIRMMTKVLGDKEREELAWSLLEEVVGADGTRAFTAQRIRHRRPATASRPSSSALAGIPVRGHPR